MKWADRATPDQLVSPARQVPLAPKEKPAHKEPRGCKDCVAFKAQWAIAACPVIQVHPAWPANVACAACRVNRVKLVNRAQWDRLDSPVQPDRRVLRDHKAMLVHRDRLAKPVRMVSLDERVTRDRRDQWVPQEFRGQRA